METGADGFVPVGYRACSGCGEFILAVGRATRCDSCVRSAQESAHLLELATLDGRVVPKRPTRARRRAKVKMSADTREHKRLWNRARSRAVQRLVRIHHDLYLAILAEEKAALGLDPHVDERPPGDGALNTLRRVG